MSSLTRGDSREAVIALWFANGVLARWQRDGTLTGVIRGPQARGLVDHALTNVCSGLLLSPLTFPGQPLGDPWPWQESDAGSAAVAGVQSH